MTWSEKYCVFIAVMLIINSGSLAVTIERNRKLRLAAKQRQLADLTAQLNRVSNVFFKTTTWTYDVEDHEMAPGWYFWDELGVYAHGPFGTEGEANHSMKTYAESL